MKNEITNRKYCLQEIVRGAEPALFLKLQHHCFPGLGAGLFAGQNGRIADIHYYDRDSLHYGLYVHRQQTAGPVGYCSIVLLKQTTADTWIKMMAHVLGLTVMANRKNNAAFPGPGRAERAFFVYIPFAGRKWEISRLSVVAARHPLQLVLQKIKRTFRCGPLLQRQQGMILYCKMDYLDFEWAKQVQQRQEQSCAHYFNR